jgi:hypothetical protein
MAFTICGKLLLFVIAMTIIWGLLDPGTSDIALNMRGRDMEGDE